MIAWAIETLIATTLLMLLVLGLRGPVLRNFGPNMAYALWILPVARMVMPPLPGDWQLTRLFGPFIRQAEQAPGMVMGVMDPARLPPEAANAMLVETQFSIGGKAVEMAVVPPTAVEGGPNLVLLLLALWAIGSLAFLAYHLIAHSRFCHQLIRRARVDRMVAEGRVRLIETDAAHGPLAFGIWRKYVAFPRDFSERYDELERDLALAHELGHHVRGDLIANWVALIVLAIHWFNPVAWRAFRAFRADQEMACDALVLAGRAPALRHAYGRAIVKSAHGGAVSAACHLHTINELKGRLRMLTRTRKLSAARIGAGMVGMTALTVSALALTASGTSAAETLKDRVENTIGVRLASLDARLQDVPPAPPADPAAPTADVPPVPPVAAVPAAPPAPPAPGTRVERHVVVTRGEDGRETRTVRVMRNGEMVDVGDIDIPEVESRRCGGENGKPMVFNSEPGPDGKKRKIVICTDRIERVTAEAAEAGAMAERHKKAAMRSALAGLRHARTSVAAQPELSDSQRAEALKGIDQAIRELETGKGD